ncbi:MAG: elongation factor Ts [Bacilli bacterium]|nr:elongation factor Ts [Bacilli bacterium]MBR3210009.1 elongation factor Ts [Bacilli bacterium]
MISASLIKELREKTGAGMLDCKKALEENAGDLEKAVDWLREKGISKAAKKADRIAAEGVAAILTSGNDAVVLEMNSETDFVAKNEKFQNLVSTVLETLIKSDVTTLEDALNLSCGDGTINDLIISNTATIGEKLSFRRFARVHKKDDESFGEYIHMGGKIAVLIVAEGVSSDVAKDVAMHAAAMRPSYVRQSDVPSDVVEKEMSVLKEQAINEGKPAEIAEKMVQGRVKKFYKEICLEDQPFVKDGDIDVKTFVKNNGGSIKEMYRFEVGEGIEKREENFAEEVAKQMK